MSCINRVTVSGNLTRDPFYNEIGAKKTPVVKFGVAVNGDKYTNKAGEEVQDVVFVNVQAWGDLASDIYSTYKKGNKICVEGCLKAEKYTNKQGVEVNGIIVNCFRVGFNEKATKEPAPSAEGTDTTNDIPF